MFRRRFASIGLCIVIAVAAFAQQPSISEKKDVAVFSLGYSGYVVPLETLASVDASILEVFVNLGRFNVIGQSERFSSRDVQTFIRMIQEAKRDNTPLPDEVKFGDVQLTQALINKLYGAFVVVIPTIVDFRSGYASARKEYETTVKTSIAFLDVAEGTTIGFVAIETSGTSKETQYKSIQSALAGIAFQLDYEVRRMPAFTLNTQVLRVDGGEVKMQFGTDMGVKRGDEYALISTTSIKGLVDETEEGLILIKSVGPQVSTGTVLYGGKALAEGAQLREVPRLGLDIVPYGRYLRYFAETNGVQGAFIGGLKFIPNRGFYELKPMVGVQVSTDWYLWFPIAAYAGVQYDRYFRRFALTFNGAVGGATNVIFKIIEDKIEEATESGNDSTFLSHFGFIGNVGLSYLVSRDVRVFVEGGAEYWFSVGDENSGPFSRYGGTGVTVGTAFKF